MSPSENPFEPPVEPNEVFYKPELLENILYHLPVQDVFTSAGVSSLWKWSIDNSKRIQEKLFLLPVAAVLNTVESPYRHLYEANIGLNTALSKDQPVTEEHEYIMRTSAYRIRYGKVAAKEASLSTNSLATEPDFDGVEGDLPDFDGSPEPVEVDPFDVGDPPISVDDEDFATWLTAQGCQGYSRIMPFDNNKVIWDAISRYVSLDSTCEMEGGYHVKSEHLRHEEVRFVRGFAPSPRDQAGSWYGMYVTNPPISRAHLSVEARFNDEIDAGLYETTVSIQDKDGIKFGIVEAIVCKVWDNIRRQYVEHGHLDCGGVQQIEMIFNLIGAARVDGGENMDGGLVMPPGCGPLAMDLEFLNGPFTDSEEDD